MTPEERHFAMFKEKLDKLAARHGTTPKVIVSILTDTDYDNDWRTLFTWRDVHEWFDGIVRERFCEVCGAQREYRGLHDKDTHNYQTYQKCIPYDAR